MLSADLNGIDVNKITGNIDQMASFDQLTKNINT
jgi:hypothetical protein